MVHEYTTLLLTARGSTLDVRNWSPGFYNNNFKGKGKGAGFLV